MIFDLENKSQWQSISIASTQKKSLLFSVLCIILKSLCQETI